MVTDETGTTIAYEVQRYHEDTREWSPCGYRSSSETKSRERLAWWRTNRPDDQFRLLRTTMTIEVVG